MVKKIISIIIVFSMILLTGCMTHTHVVGKGAQTGTVEQERQWYALWGLIPINTVDSKVMAGGAENYTIKTEMAPLDILINIVTGMVTIYSRTVEISK